MSHTHTHTHTQTHTHTSILSDTRTHTHTVSPHTSPTSQDYGPLLTPYYTLYYSPAQHTTPLRVTHRQTDTDTEAETQTQTDTAPKGVANKALLTKVSLAAIKSYSVLGCAFLCSSVLPHQPFASLQYMAPAGYSVTPVPPHLT